MRGIGGRCISPSTVTRVPGTSTGASRSAANTASIAAGWNERTSSDSSARSGTTLRRSPPRSTPTQTVAAAGSCSAAARTARCAAWTTAFAPSAWSLPACAARPSTVIRTSAVPLRAVLTPPSGSAHSSTSTAVASRESCAIRSRVLRLPISSSGVSDSRQPTSGAIAASASTAAMATTMPPFMSAVPGPYALPSRTVSGRSAAVPGAQTVS